MKAITHAIVVTIASPFILLEGVLRKTGLLKVITNTISTVLEERTNNKRRRREALIQETQSHLHCKNIDTYTSFWMGDTCMGSYGNGRIKLNAEAKGISLIETMFHEDRHYQQEQANPKCFIGYIKAEDDYRGYIRQHVEKDARRYAYVTTMRHAKHKLGVRFYLFAPLYRLQSHPWKNTSLKKYR